MQDLRRSHFAPRLMLLVAAVVLGSAWWAEAQTSKTKPKSKPPASNPGSLKSLDARAEKLHDQFVREAQDLAKEYESEGQYDRARTLLEALGKLDPKLPGIKEKITQLTDLALGQTEIDFELDVSKNWVQPGVQVVKDKPVRIEVDGEYNFVATVKSSPNGLPTAEPATDLIPGVETGAVVGVLSNNGKPGKPFAVKAKFENTFKEEGVLYLKVNVPSGHKSTGKLKVKLSGFIRAPLQ